ncbi:MAG: ribosome small subunit-dependent GTPase A [Candidatus Eisenbacteria bacterium]|nr:ribosome small subunit-dependent GTPase A [Candidatus Eisenbacteria bacterium]
MTSSIEKGTVLACFHDEWEVALDSGEVLRCSVRARHFADRDSDEKLLAAGDRVEVSVHDDGTTVIERRLPRETVLSRVRPRMKRDVEQVIVANAEQLVVVVSLANPKLNRRFLDRYLVIAEDAGLRPIVVFNKIDLVPEQEWEGDAKAYDRAGYPVVPTCAVDGRGVDVLRSHLSGAFSVFAGPSGAGKSSLLNAIEPGLGIRIREVSQATSKGRHTTSNVTIFRFGDGIMVADTPGLRELGLWEVHPDDLALLFPEFSDYAPHCKFSTCSHGPEPGCAVRDAVDSGEVDRDRYESYLKLLGELRSGRQ